MFVLLVSVVKLLRTCFSVLCQHVYLPKCNILYCKCNIAWVLSLCNRSWLNMETIHLEILLFMVLQALNYLFNSDLWKKWSVKFSWSLGELWSPFRSRSWTEPCWGTRKIWILCSKGHTLAYYLFIFHIKFSAVWGIFV